MSSSSHATLDFICKSCSTTLTVPHSMAGVSGPCPSCQSPVTAPELAIIHPPARMSRTVMVCGLIAASAGLYWSLSHELRARNADLPMRITINNPLQKRLDAETDPRAAATLRAEQMIRQFLSATDWKDARKLVSDQDITGSISEPAWKPDEFRALAAEGKLKPVQLSEKESPGEYQIVWQIEKSGDANRLMLTTADTPAGPKVRWHQPPSFTPLVGGTQPTVKPAGYVAPPAAPISPPAKAQPDMTAEQATALAATSPTSPAQGAAALVAPHPSNKGGDSHSTALSEPAPKASTLR